MPQPNFYIQNKNESIYYIKENINSNMKSELIMYLRGERFEYTNIPEPKFQNI